MFLVYLIIYFTTMKHTISFENGVYVFEYSDEYGFVVTDGKDIETLRKNIKEAMNLRFDGIKDLKKKWKQKFTKRSWNFVMPVTLSFSEHSYAFDLQEN